MPDVELALLGRFQARCGGKEISLPTRKTRLLLAYLALPPGEPRARETLIGLLWSDRNEEQARGSLRNALSALRKSIGSDALRVEEDTVALIPGVVETDVSRFELLAKEGTAEALETASAIYRDDLLKGTNLPGSNFQDWLSFEQTRLRELACRVLFDLIALRVAAGNQREALDIARRLLAIDPLDEEVHRILMRLYSETNQRAQALRQYKVCARTLEQELGIEPEEETTALRDKIRTCAPNRTLNRAQPAEPAVAAAPVTKETATADSQKGSHSPNVAVLPFGNMGGDPAQEYFVDGITEDIITALCRFRWLPVTSRNSSFAFKGKPAEVRDVAKELGARYVVQGSVRQGGGRLRINAQLIDAESDKNLWAERYDRSIEDVLTLQDDIAETIAAAIAPELEGAESRRARRQPPESLDAWDLYQRGRWHLHRPEDEGNTEARRLFRQAIEADPTFAAAYTGLAITGYFSVMFGLGDTPAARLAEAKTAAQQALALDEKDAFAHSVLGQIYFMQRQFDMGFPEVQTGVALNPHSARVRFALGWAHTFAGETEEALLSLEKAAQLSPHDPSIWAVMSLRAIAHIVREEYEDAATWARRSARRPNARFWANASLAAALGHLGRDQDARRAVEKIFAMKPDFSLAFVADTLPFKEKGHQERYLEGLRRAGVTDRQDKPDKMQHPGAAPADPPPPATTARPQTGDTARSAPPPAPTARPQTTAAATSGTSGTVKLSQPGQKIRFCTSADGAKIAYAAVGQGPPLVKTANWLNHLEYDWQGPVWRHLFAELTRDHTLVRYDERGNGLSDWDVDDISFEGFVSDLEAVVDAMGLDCFPLLAVSQGCPVAAAYAVRHPQRVTHLILHGGFSRGWRVRGSKDEIRRREALITLMKQGWEQNDPGFQQIFSSLYLPDSTPEQALWWSELMRITTSLENMLLLQDAFGEIDVSALLSRVTTPTLVLHSIRDGAVPVEEGRRMANAIPGARFVPLESRNHLIMDHEPAWPRFVSEIKGFLNTG